MADWEFDDVNCAAAEGTERDFYHWAIRLIMFLAGLILLCALLVDNTFEHGKFDKMGDTWYLVASN